MPNLCDMPPLKTPREEDMIDGFIDIDLSQLSTGGNPLISDSDLPYNINGIYKCTKNVCHYVSNVRKNLAEFSEYAFENRIIY